MSAPVARTGSYVGLCEIASGGMGTVELAVRKEGSFQRCFAIKRLLPALRADPGIRSMFVEEARLAGLLQHPNVVSVIDVGEDHDGPFLVMDYVEGLSLANISSSLASLGARMPIATVLRLLSQCARGLHAAHELHGPDGTWLHLVHRDVSPQNILVGFDGVVRLTDFGIAKAAGSTNRTSTGLLKGKSGYLAPEQLRFEEPDRRADLFALGIVLFETLTGARMFKSESLREAARKILNDEPPDLQASCPAAPSELALLVRRMLARDPEARPPNARVVAEALDDIAASLPDEERAYDVAAFMGERFHREAAANAARVRDWIAATDLAQAEESARRSLAPAPEQPTRRARIAPGRRRPHRGIAALLGVIAIFGVLSAFAANARWLADDAIPNQAPQTREPPAPLEAANLDVPEPIQEEPDSVPPPDVEPTEERSIASPELEEATGTSAEEPRRERRRRSSRDPMGLWSWR